MLRRLFRFFDAEFGCAAAAHIACGEIKNTGAIAHFDHADECAATGLFHIVGMGGDGEDVERAEIFERFVGIVHGLVEIAPGIGEQANEQQAGQEAADVSEPGGAAGIVKAA